MAILPSNSFYSSFAKKTKGSGSVPPVSPFSFTGSLGHPNTGNVSGSAFKPPLFGSTPGAPGAPGVPGAPPAPSAAPAGFTGLQGTLPPDPVYEAAISALQGTETNTLAGLTQARGAYLQGAGYTEGVGPDGKPTIAFDPNNPYSQAALMRQHSQQAHTGNTTSYAAAGQLYAGSLQNAQNAETDRFNAADSGLTSAVINFLANNTIQQGAAHTAYNTGAGAALGQSVQSAPNNPLYDPTRAGANSGATLSTNPDGLLAVTGGPGGSALVPQQPNSTVKLASGYSIVYGPDGKALYFLDPSGNRMTGTA